MREPSTAAQRWAWYDAWTAGEDPPIHDGEPHAGFFAVRRFRYGEWTRSPLVPARIWWAPAQTDPETGELVADEKLLAEVDGKPTDPWRIWTWVARRPIPETEWQFLRAMSPLLPTKIPRRA